MESDWDFVTVKIPRPLAVRWAKGGFDWQSDDDRRELVHWLKAGFDWHNSKQSLFSAWGNKYLR